MNYLGNILSADQYFVLVEGAYPGTDVTDAAAMKLPAITLKNDFIAGILEMKLPESKSEALAVLRNTSEQFSTMGHVPLKNKNDVYERFKKAIDAKYSSLKLEAEEKDRILFQAKIDTLGSSPERQKLLTNEKNDIRKQMDALGKEIIQMENNLGFFARSKGADQLRKEVEGKVQVLQSKIDGLKKKLKLIPHE